MTKPSGVHHLAISTNDMKSQIAFFTDVLGMELVALYWMHGVEGAWHGFLKLNDNSAVAFVFTKDVPSKETIMGTTHAGEPGNASAPGTMQHVAFNADTYEELLNLRDRIRSRGVPVFGPLRHGFCSSIYFAGPENLTLEVSTSDGAEFPLDHDGTWIDPEIVALAGISADELSHYLKPEPYEGQGGGVAQPDADPAKPHMYYPPDAYRAMLQIPDEEYTRTRSIIDPPSPPAAAQ